jgi:DGQHR domain-containing protein
MEIPVIPVNQVNAEMYIGKITITQLRQLHESKRLKIDQFDPVTQQGYQRVINPRRVNELSEFLSARTHGTILAPLLPNSVVMNCREPDGLHYDPATTKIIISDSAELHVIDGQHRVGSALVSRLRSYDLPVTFLLGLNVAQEAAQFLTINTKQKKVRPDLQLRVLYHMDRRNTQRLIDVLSVENWRLEGVTLVIALNDRNESSWRNMIRRPGEKAGRRWTPMTESNYEDTLRFFCGSESSVKEVTIQDKEQFLLDYWDAIRGAFPDAFKDPNGRSYVICKSIGVGIFNTLAPLAYWLDFCNIVRVCDLGGSISRAFPLEKWRKPTGEFARMGTSQKMYQGQAERIIRRIDSRFDYTDEGRFRQLHKRMRIKEYERSLEKALRTLSPIHLRASRNLSSIINPREHACYVLWRAARGGARVYVGQAVDARRRLRQHRDFELYHCRLCADERELNLLEQALYHLVKPGIRDNSNHPPKRDRCPYC